MPAAPLRRRLQLLTLSALLTITIAACGGVSDDPMTPAAETSPAVMVEGADMNTSGVTSPEGEPAQNNDMFAEGILIVQLMPNTDNPEELMELTLECGPNPSGTVPDPMSACALLNGVGLDALVDGVAEDAACAMIYGGPASADVVGNINGTEINASLNRSNGCQMALWDAMVDIGLLPGGLEEPAKDMITKQ